MSYQRLKIAGIICPRCQRKLEILFEAEDVACFCLCFTCRKFYEFTDNQLQPISAAKKATGAKTVFFENLLAAFPEKNQYKGHGSQLREIAGTYQRRWLSLAEYERQFGESLHFTPCDLRQNLAVCKWCGNSLPKGRKAFCKDSCSRNYSKATFTKRQMASLPYQIASRDLFFCQVSHEDLAQYNRFKQRIPVSNGSLAIHHLVLVSENGTDHEKNLLTLSAEIHRQYHAGEAQVVEKINQIRDERLKNFAAIMQF